MKASGQDKWQAMFQAFYGWLCRMHRLPSLQTLCLFTDNSLSPSPGFLWYSYSLTALHYLASFEVSLGLFSLHPAELVCSASSSGH